MIIDFRLRPPFKGFLNTLMWNVERTRKINARLGFTSTPSIELRSLDSLFTEMDDAGIALGVVAGRDARSVIGGVDNAEVLEVQRQYPARFIGIPSVDTGDPRTAVEQIDRHVKSSAARGIVVEPGVAPTPTYPSDPVLFPIYERCQTHDVAVLIMGGGNAGPDISYSDPIHVDRVAAAFPRLRIVATHGGWPFVQQIIGVAFRRPNVYVCPDMYLLDNSGCVDYVAAANSHMQDQLVFATSYPFTSLKEYVDRFMALPWRPNVLDKLLYRNARAALGLE